MFSYDQETEEFTNITDFAKLSDDKKSIVKKKARFINRKKLECPVNIDSLTIENVALLKTSYIKSDGGRIQKRITEVLMAPEKYKVCMYYVQIVPIIS